MAISVSCLDVQTREKTEEKKNDKVKITMRERKEIVTQRLHPAKASNRFGKGADDTNNLPDAK